VYKGKKKESKESEKEEFVAMKKIKQEDEKEGMPITTLREITLLSKLKHKNIVNLIEVIISKCIIQISDV
jgi:serine/threonine protein kinase